MATTFKVIFLGNIGVDIDQTEGNRIVEDAASLLNGTSYGASGDPLYGHIQEFTPGVAGYLGGLEGHYDTNNDLSLDDFRLDGGDLQVVDSTVSGQATLTYADGTTATLSNAVFFQDTDGNLYLAPQLGQNSDQIAMEAKAILSIKVDSIIGTTGELVASRAVGNYAEPDGIVTGTSGDDIMPIGYVDANGDAIDGSDGNNDSIVSGDGNDSIQAGAGNDTLIGGDGNDYLSAGDDDDLIEGGVGNDHIDSGAGNDTADGGVGDDDIDGERGNDLLTGGEGNDSISGSFGDDTIDAGVGNDVIYAGYGNDSIDAGAGIDYIELINGNDTVFAGDDQDNIRVAAGSYLDGAIVSVDGGTGGGTDVIDTDVDEMDLREWAAYRNLEQTQDADLDSFSGSVELLDANGNWITLNFSEIEIMQLPSEDLTPDYIVEGTVENDLIDANYTGDPEGDRVDAGDNLAGNNDDSIQAGAGNDTIRAGGGDDTIYGGDGRDWIYGEGGSDSIYGGEGNEIVYAGAGNDTIHGEDGNDHIDANDGDDLLYGDAGDDTLHGGAGADTLEGGIGGDSIGGEAGDDVIRLSDSFGNDTIVGGETSETLGDTLDLSGLTTGVTVDLTDANSETGTVSDGTSTAEFTEIENIILGGGRDTVVLADGSGAHTVQGFSMYHSGDGTTVESYARKLVMV